MPTDPYSDNLDAIEAILRYFCRLKRLSAEECEEFCSWARIKLLENDRGILRQYKGDASFKTFLLVVLRRKFTDWLREKNGKFHVSAEAERLGPIACELERLILRDGMDYEQAAQTLVSRGIAPSMKACDEIWARLPHVRSRPPLTELKDDDDVAAPVPPDPIEMEQARELAARVLAAVRVVLAQLPPADNLIFRWRYWEGISVAKIAKLQGIEQKPLYRRFDQIHRQIKRGLLGQGLTEEEIWESLDRLGVDVEDQDSGDEK